MSMLFVFSCWPQIILTISYQVCVSSILWNSVFTTIGDTCDPSERTTRTPKCTKGTHCKPTGEERGYKEIVHFKVSV